ncbi:hypothetical protein TraAM80_10334, partial [Trypanosoma rangeli]
MATWSVLAVLPVAAVVFGGDEEKRETKGEVRCGPFSLPLRMQGAACGSVVLKRGTANCNSVARGGRPVLSEFAAALGASARHFVLLRIRAFLLGCVAWWRRWRGVFASTFMRCRG